MILATQKPSTPATTPVVKGSRYNSTFESILAQVQNLGNSELMLPEKPTSRIIHCPYELATDAEFYAGTQLAALETGSKLPTLKEFERVLGDSQPIFSSFQWRNRDTLDRIQTFALEHPLYGKGLLPVWQGESAIVHSLGLKEAEAPTRGKAKLYVIPFYFFYSTCDIWYTFVDRSLCFKMAKQIVKHRTHKVNPDLGFQHKYLTTGVYFELPLETGEHIVCELAFDLKDQGGKGTGGLAKVASGYGIAMDDKGLMDAYKTNMRQAYDNMVDMVEVDGNWVSLHDACIQYGVGDVPVLFDIADKSSSMFQGVVSQLGLSVKLRPFNTVGGVTNQISVAKMMEGMQLIQPDTIEYTDEDKLTLLNMLLPGSAEFINDAGGTAPMLSVLDGGYCKNMQPRTPRWHNKLLLDLDLKGCYMEALVHQDFPFGRPLIISTKKTEESISLKKFLEVFKNELVPGLWYARISNKEKFTFDIDLLLSKHFGKKGFEDADFDQDWVNEESVGFEIANEGANAKQLTGAFQLNTRQWTNAMLTHDLLEAFACGTKAEYDEIMQKVHVDAALLYPASAELPVETFKQVYTLKSEVDYRYDKFNLTKDVRNASCWTRINMGHKWCQEYINFRNQNKLLREGCEDVYKGNETTDASKLVLAKHEHNRPANVDKSTYYRDQRDIYNGSQYAFKISGLAIFGTGGSMHYQSQSINGGEKANPKSGNFCVANNITARARLGVWALSKRLLTAVVITDGGFFDINYTCKWNWKGKDKQSVGFDTLCKLSNPNLSTRELTNRGRLNIRIEPLGRRQWELTEVSGEWITITNGTKVIKGKEEKWGGLDHIAFEAVRNQFPMLSIFQKRQFKFASKQLYNGGCTQSQANYLLVPFEGLTNGKGQLEKIKIAARGYKGADKVGNKSIIYTSPTCDPSTRVSEHPFYTQMHQIYVGRQVCDMADVYRGYTSEMLGVNDYNQTPKSQQEYEVRNILPNEPVPRPSFPRPLSLSMFRWQTFEQYKSWNKHHESLRERTGWGVEGYFPFATIKETYTRYDKLACVVDTKEVTVMLTMDYDKAIVTIQDAIDEGADWVVPVGGKGKKVEHGVMHPELVFNQSTYAI
jgi:hypothetical protein